MKDVIIVDDEKDIRTLLSTILEDEQYTVRAVADSCELFETLKGRHPSVIFLDIWLKKSKLDGIEILHKLVKYYPHIDVVMISGHGNAETAVRAMQIGAYDFLEKPIKSSHLLLVLERIIDVRKIKLISACSRLEKYVPVNEIPVFLSGNSSEITTIRSIVQKHADKDSRVLISGEAGTGKRELAHYIHQCSIRKNERFVQVLSSSIKLDAISLEKKLFGYSNPENPEYVGQIGAFEEAHSGSLYLEHIDLYPHAIQKKIVKFLVDKKYQRFMSPDKIVQCDVRLLASTSLAPELSVSHNLLLHDLFVRLNVVCVNMPTVKQRHDDIPVIIKSLVMQFSKEYPCFECHFSEDLILFLQVYDWKNNLRELSSVIRMLVTDAYLRQDKEPISCSHLPSSFHKKSIVETDTLLQSTMLNKPLREAREVFERDYLMAQLTRFKGNISKTAQFVGMERSALHRKLRGLDIENSRDFEEMSVA